jgi:hypothetical protein
MSSENQGAFTSLLGFDLIYKHMPNYQQKIEWLKINGSTLI